MLEDFDATKIVIDKVPKNASQTYAGSRLLKSIVQPIKYKGKQMPQDTIREFDLDERDQVEVKGTKLHNCDHV